MYKLIALDLDGTLLNDNKDISKEDIYTIEELVEKDYEIVIATGRRYWSAKNAIKHMKGNFTILANNGNIIRQSESDIILDAKYLNLGDFKTIIEEGQKRDLHPIIHVDGYERGYDIIIALEKESKHYFNFLRNANRLKKIDDYSEIIDDYILAIVYPGLKKYLNPFYIDINKKYPNIYNTHIMDNVGPVEALLEIMNPSGSKWYSLLEYANKKGISSKEIIAIGDNNNDIDMIENAGLGIAMKNSSSAVKKVAKVVTEKDNNNSGVGFELRRVLNI